MLDLGKVSAAIASNMLCNACEMQTLTVNGNFTSRRGLVTDIHVSGYALHTKQEQAYTVITVQAPVVAVALL